ncbi:hypothetical protein [Microcoleus sp. B4-C1]|uniref:hypothetical protein n=1 Tax=Microcoleus sp. B4-C1 TaxID=2818660 RepID=UPI002FD3DA66
MPKQIPPIQRRLLRRGETCNERLFNQWKSLQSSEISALPLSDIANNPSILLDEGEFLSNDPLIHFDIEKPIPPIEMCDVYCSSQMCDVYCIDAKERIIHGHIYNDIKGDKTQDHLISNTQGKIIHGHIYGDVDRQNL